MRELLEDNITEFKSQFTDDVVKEVVAFLNSNTGGKLYIGVDDSGEVIDTLQLQISDKLKNLIKPTTLGLFDILVKSEFGKSYILIIISGGPDKPYYLTKKGMSPTGCYIRVGSGNQQMPEAMIENMFSKRTRTSLSKIPSPKSDLGFEQLQIYYQNKGLFVNDRFLSNLELLTEDGKFNYTGYLLSDENGVSIRVAKYSGTDKTDLIANEEYGYCSLVKALKNVLNKLEIENTTSTKITYRERIDRKLLDPHAVKEAVINAFVHHDYTFGATPVVEIFSDRIEIVSCGGLVNTLTEDDFYSCRSMPRNRELIRVFKDLGLVEQLGSGMSRILRAYDKTVFSISDNFIVVTLKFNSHKEYTNMQLF